MRAAAIDLGTKTIGLAVSDAGWSLAAPRRTIARTKFTADATALAAFLKSEAVGALVVGLPLNMDDSEGPRAQSTRAFMRNYDRLHPVPFLFFDERLSTAAADDAMRDAGVKAVKRAARIDAAAAAIILQGLLDQLPT
ncbi:MAG: Holliday junction resolvase RuvX [Rhizobiaceae bacterium]|nr:Holliday junction resolvase RuvX [Rhizobiaceae bacterium]